MCSHHAACDRKDTDTLFFIIFIYFLIWMPLKGQFSQLQIYFYLYEITQFLIKKNTCLAV